MLWLRTWRLGVKSLLLHPMRSLLTVLGIFIGVASVIWLLAIGEGISRKAQEQIEELGATNIIVRSVKPSDDVFSDSAFFIDYGLKRDDYDLLLATVPTIKEILRIREFPRSAKYGTHEMDVRLVGCTPKYAEVMRLRAELGHFISDKELENAANVCVLADGTAKTLFPLINPIGKTIILRDKAFVVVGVTAPRTAMAGIGGSLAAQDFANDIYIPYSTLWKQIGDTIYIRTSGSRSGETIELSQLTIQVHAAEDVLRTAELVRRTLAPRHPNNDYAVVVPMELLEQARTTRLMFILFMGMIAAISLLVGGIGIMNIMLATVTERTREIGIRRALGAKRRDIVHQFLTETIVLSVAGGATGVLGGLACIPLTSLARQALESSAPEIMANLPAVVKTVTPTIVPASIPLAFGISVAVGVIFGLYPAVRAAKMDPIEALRHE